MVVPLIFITVICNISNVWIRIDLPVYHQSWSIAYSHLVPPSTATKQANITNRVWNLYKSFLSSCFKTKESWLWIPWQQCVGCCIRVYMSENVEKSLLLLLPTCIQCMLPMLSLHPAFFEDAPSVLTTKHRTGKTCSPFSLVRSKKIWNKFPNHNLLLQRACPAYAWN
jgi:hypothetical protein